MLRRCCTVLQADTAKTCTQQQSRIVQTNYQHSSRPFAKLMRVHLYDKKMSLSMTIA